MTGRALFLAVLIVGAVCAWQLAWWPALALILVGLVTTAKAG